MSYAADHPSDRTCHLNEVTYIIVITVLAGICMPLGGLIASIASFRRKWLTNEFRHFLIAFGGGLMLGAVFQVLLPEGMAQYGNSVDAIFVFIAGGVTFFAVERFIGLRRREAPQLTGMLLDYLPESMALGGLVATDPSLALVLAIVVGLQNLPEGFNAYRELLAAGNDTSRVVLIFMLLLTPLGPTAALLAYFFLTEMPVILGAVMLFAAGGILYLMFQDIAPQSRLARHWAPPLGAVIGFGVTMLTDILLSHG